MALQEVAEGITAVAIQAASAAGAHALQGFRNADLVVAQKTDKHDLVTTYDQECEALITQIILSSFPGSIIIGEESGVQGASGELTWFVDPIDGTSNFAAGIPMWAVSVAVARDGEMVCGVVFDPVNDHLFWADDRGAFLTDSGRTSPIRSQGSVHAHYATVALNFPLARDLIHFPELALQQFAEVTHDFAQVRGLGSTCIALCWTAVGWIDATISFETNPWDIAAGAFIIRSAGGVFYGYKQGHILPRETDHFAPHYYAAVAGGEFPVLHEIMKTQSCRPADTKSDTAE